MPVQSCSTTDETRLQAKRLELRITGTLGMLPQARKLGLIESPREEPASSGNRVPHIKEP
ncbi:MAG: hypothetical protein F7B59_08030 [Desulfurococcales archaeon]|nr:hypothetical protein [Desulfurococcales archaeon]